MAKRYNDDPGMLRRRTERMLHMPPPRRRKMRFQGIYDRTQVMGAMIDIGVALTRASGPYGFSVRDVIDNVPGGGYTATVFYSNFESMEQFRQIVCMQPDVGRFGRLALAYKLKTGKWKPLNLGQLNIKRDTLPQFR